MYKVSALALLLVASSFAMLPPAQAAGDVICVDDLCLVVEAPVPCWQDTDCGTPPCASSTYTVTGFWYYLLGSGEIRDPPLEGMYYRATWTYSTYYEPEPNGGCRETAYSCHVQVSDGSHFQYLRVGSASSANGLYKGVPTMGGTLSCGSSSAELHTYGAFLIAIHGYGFQ